MTDENQTTVQNWVEQARAIERGEAPADKVIKLTGPNSVTSPGPDQPTYKTQHAKVLRIEVSIGQNDDDRTLEQFEADCKRLLRTDPGPQGLPPHNITTLGGYYLIDGKVCMPDDYDPATKNRKPGTYPPRWAGGPDPSKQQHPTDDDVTDDTDNNAEQAFVRVAPTKPRRDPLTGVKPRKERSDKGVRKGTRKTEADKVAATEAITRMREQAETEIAG